MLMKRLVSMVLIAAFLGLGPAHAQVPAEVWRGFAEKVAVGSEMNVRLQDGTRFRATLVGVRDDAVLLQPKTRATVPVQAVPYADIASLEPRKNGGSSAVKAAAIGVATGVASFFGIMLIFLAVSLD
jgi:hypothetical protein